MADELGLYLYGLHLSRGKRYQLRVLADRREKVDASDGVAVGELQRLHRTLERALDLEGLIGEDYALEVSSPGLERTLDSPRHFVGAIRETVEVVTAAEIDGRNKFTGTLVAANDETLTIDEGSDALVDVRLADIRRARTVFRM